MRGCAFAALALLMVGRAEAATYYVSPDGSDAVTCANAVDSATPKKTIGNAKDCLAAGDTLVLRGGEYAEEVQWVGGPSGTSWSNPITLRAQDGETPLVVPPVGADFALSMRASGAGAGDGPAYIVFDGITFDGTNAAHDVVKIGAWDATIDPPDGPAHHIRFQNGRITSTVGKPGVQQGILITWGSDGVELVGMEIDHIGRTGAPNSQCIYGAGHDLLIDRTRVHDCGGSGGFCLSNINSYAGFDVRNHVIKNSAFYDCAGSGINVGEGSGHLVFNNVVYRNQGSGIILAGYGAGASTGIRVYNNTVYGNAQAGIQINGDQTGADIANNVMHENGAPLDDSGSSTQLRNNRSDGTDPQFVNVAAGDFHLLPSSPLRDIGVTLSDVTTDKDGVARPQGTAYDVGAYEWSEGGPPDAGGSGGGTAGNGGASGIGGTGATAGRDGAPDAGSSRAAGSADEANCACRAPRPGRSDPGSLLAAVSAIVALGSFRRARRRTST